LYKVIRAALQRNASCFGKVLNAQTVAAVMPTCKNDKSCGPSVFPSTQRWRALANRVGGAASTGTALALPAELALAEPPAIAGTNNVEPASWQPAQRRPQTLLGTALSFCRSL